MRSSFACFAISLLIHSQCVRARISECSPSTQEQTKEPSTSKAQAETTDAVRPKPAPVFDFGLEDGTPVSLTLARELSSGKEAPGNRVDFEVARDIVVNGMVVIPKGSMAWGTIVNVKPKRRLGRAGRLDVRIDEVRLVDGERAPLRASQESKGKGRSGVMTGAIIASGVLFFPVAPLFLFMHGKDVIIAKGTPVTAYVDGNMALDQSKFLAPQPTASPASPPTAR